MESPLAGIRREKDLSQERLAFLAGVSQGHISDVENGYTKIKGKLSQFLDGMGYDLGKLAAEHDKFMQIRKREELEKLMRSAVEK